MSRLYFHTEHDGEAEVMGWEHHHLHGIPISVAAGFVPTDSERLGLNVTRAGRSMLRFGTPYLHLDVKMLLRSTSEIYCDSANRPLETWALSLNTALRAGSDVVALASRIAAQAEIHCYVEGENRDWMRSLILEGRRVGLLRADAGWEDVMSLLSKSDTGPVVLSYSVTESFPNSGVAGWCPEDATDDLAWDGWYDLPDAQKWEMGMSGLRQSGSDGLELSPKNLRYPFGHSMSFIDIFGPTG